MAKYTKIDSDSVNVTLLSVVDPALIRRWENRYREMALSVFPRALQWSLMQVAKTAQDLLADEVEAAFDTPVSFTNVRSGKDDLSHTSVRRWSKRLPKHGELSVDEVESAIYVMRRQSACFKFALGEPIRRPGDIGLAEDYIGIPIWHNLTNLQGIMPTREGNLPRRSMSTLHRRQKPETMTRNERGRAELGIGHHYTFFGTPYPGAQEGWYDRPQSISDRTGEIIKTGTNKGLRKMVRRSTGRPALLIAVHQRTQHEDILTPGWNRAIAIAADGLHLHLAREYEDYFDHRAPKEPYYQGNRAPGKAGNR